MSNNSMYSVNISYVFMFTFCILGGLLGNYVVYPQKRLKINFRKKLN